MSEIGGIPSQLEPLIRRFDNAEPRVLLVVGTGISFGATNDSRSTWKGLLIDAIDTLADRGTIDSHTSQAERILIENAFTKRFDLDEILQRAESVTNYFGGIESQYFVNWLAESIGSLKARPDRRETIEAIADLGRSGAIILTTNYDDILCEATNLPPVTWEEPKAILEILNRKRNGIIHIHGHWTRPSSVVLGRSSYARVKEAALTQTQLKGLWLYWRWLFLGCGSGGLDDPNMGALLQWAYETKLKESALPDFFISTQDTIDRLPSQLTNSGNTIALAYSDHAVGLPLLLRKLSPEARTAPFHLVGPHAHRVRHGSELPLRSPFPSWEEYLEGRVPGLAADEQVSQRLADHGWAFVIDSASVGKTTLALRIAALAERKHLKPYYLLLTRHVSDDTENDISPQGALARLARPGALFIIDDCHLQPELAYTLWEQWRERRNGSLLLLLATRVEKMINLLGDTGLIELEAYPSNPAIGLQLTSQDMGSIAKYVVARADAADHRHITIPQDALSAWHKAFSREVGAFVVAVSQRRSELLRGDFALPPSSGAAWIEARYLQQLDEQDIRNAECLAVFGAQEYEADVPEQCLPHPSRVGRLLKSGLVVKYQGGWSSRYSLREPGWGILILSALDNKNDKLDIFVNSARNDIYFLTVISSMLKQNSNKKHFLYFWEKISDIFSRDEEQLTEKLLTSPLECVAHFANIANELQHTKLVNDFWVGLAREKKRLSERTFNVSLEHVARFLNVAKAHKQLDLVRDVWADIAKDPKRLSDYSLDVSPQHVARFLTVAMEHGQAELVRDVWEELAKDPKRLSERMFQTYPDDFGRLLKVATDQEQVNLVSDVWLELAKDLRRLVEHVFEVSLGRIAPFIKVARRHKQVGLISNLCAELARDPKRLAEHALESSLDSTLAFMHAALDSGQNELVNILWASLAEYPGWLESYASKHRIKVWGDLRRPIYKYRIVNPL